MQQKKLPTDLSVEELIQELNSNTTPKEVIDVLPENHILSFFSFYNIKSGSNKVKRSLIYRIYKNWSKAKNVNHQTFTKELSVYIKCEGIYCYINFDAIDLSLKAKEALVKSDETERAKSTRLKENVSKFISTFGINNGKYAIDGLALYYLYEGWTYNNRYYILAVSDFYFVMKYHINYEKQRYQHMNFFIDKDSLLFTGEELEKAKTWAKNNRLKNKEKGKKVTT